MIDLNSPRWSELRHAYGPATDVPRLIQAIADEPAPRYSETPADARERPTPWDTVYSSLCHQYGVYSATYAAFPHIVSIAEADGLPKRVETLLLAGAICVHGEPDPDIPADLIPEFDAVMRRVRKWSLPTVRAAELADRYVLPYLLRAFGGLRNPKSVFVRSVDRLVPGDCELEIDTCPYCQNHVLVEMTADGPTSVPCDARGMPIQSRAKMLAVDRSGYFGRVELGQQVLLQGDDPDWSEPETGDVLAALAVERGDSDLATRILDINSTIACPHCGGTFDLAKGLAS